jgi:hypothetical protein
MPAPATLEAFVARVEANDHVGAIEDYYTEDATMQENGAVPRAGRAALVANERRVLARARAVRSTCVRPVLVNGDIVVIRWIFEFDWLDGSRTRMEELAWQRWRGERIAEERFFYDPAQLVPQRPEA